MPNPSPSRSVLTGLLIVAVVATPLLLYLAVRSVPARGTPPPIRSFSASFAASPIAFRAEAVGGSPAATDRPKITNLQIVDLLSEGRPGLLACDAVRSQVVYYTRTVNGWRERAISPPEALAAAAHATPVDLDGDGDQDVVLAVLGDVLPTDERVGAVVWLENAGGLPFIPHILWDDARRVADVQAGDLDNDGDVDLVVAEFGYAHGRVFWLENRGAGRFADHPLWAAEGAIHVPLRDLDDDGDLDITAVISQEHEEVWAFENLGERRFRPRRLFGTLNFDLGSSGLFATDLDGDGDADFLLTAGDALETVHHYPQPSHGCYLLENQGGWRFRSRQIAELAGVYAADTGDLDGDGDQDVVLVSMFNDWLSEGAASVVWLENDGRQQFRTWQIAARPVSLCTVAVGDLEGDGRPEIVAGGLHIREPFDRLGRITLWRSGERQP